MSSITPWDPTNNPYEVAGSRQIRINSKGVTGTYMIRNFPYSWFEEGVPVTNSDSTTSTTPLIGSLLPEQGTPWSNTYFYCRCQDINVREIENGMAEATVNYTSEGFTSDLQLDINCGNETHTVPSQAKWGVTTPSTSASNPYVAEQEIIDPYINYKVTYRTSYAISAGYTRYNYLQYAKTCACAYKRVNTAEWHTFPAGTLLLDDLRLTPEFALRHTTTANDILIGLTLECNFKVYTPTTGTTWNSTTVRSQQTEWMPPVPLRTPDGNEYVWHNLPNQPYPFYLFYTTDTYKVGTKVYKDDVTIGTDASGNPTISVVTPTPTHGGFYKPYMTDSTNVYYKYGSCNFTTVLGIPDITAPTTGGA